MMDKDCAIARDLMPQVIDNVSSDESKAFVETHVAGCEPCTQVYTDMQAEFTGAETPENSGEPVSFKTAMSQLKKTMGWKRIRVATVAALITAVVLLLVYTGYFFLFVQGQYALPNDDYQLHLFQSEDNSVYVIPRFLKQINFSGVSSSFDKEHGIITVHWKSPRIPTGKEIIPRWYPDYVMRLTLTDEGILKFGDMTVQEVRQGTKDDYVVVYRTGDAIPPLDPTFAAYIQQRDLYFAKIDAANDAAEEARMDYQDAMMEAQTDYQDYLEQWEAEQDAQPTENPTP